MQSNDSTICRNLFDNIPNICKDASESAEVAFHKPSMLHACITACSWILSTGDRASVHDLALIYMRFGVSHANDSTELLQVLRMTRQTPFRIGELLECALNMNKNILRSQQGTLQIFTGNLNNSLQLCVIADYCNSSQTFEITSRFDESQRKRLVEVLDRQAGRQA